MTAHFLYIESNNEFEYLLRANYKYKSDIHYIHNEHRPAVIYTDSKITLDSIRSPKNHNHLVEEIRKGAVALNKENWKIEFKYMKAHAGIYGNEMANRLKTTALHTAEYQKAL